MQNPETDYLEQMVDRDTKEVVAVMLRPQLIRAELRECILEGFIREQISDSQLREILISDSGNPLRDIPRQSLSKIVECPEAEKRRKIYALIYRENMLEASTIIAQAPKIKR